MLAAKRLGFAFLKEENIAFLKGESKTAAESMPLPGIEPGTSPSIVTYEGSAIAIML